ncbi:GntR family transcriptional regulator [Comamonas testosteroni]|uniref:GntR family transcriptional regulator n=2 Tax=Comamonas testosteroni TaxID=285 RepID=A0A5A7MF21_COMTE|nr:GntR family transcriptional regulator [Comamonas testosteroni]
MSFPDFRQVGLAAASDDLRTSLPRRASLGEDVYETLLSQLISLRIAPGSRIAVDQLVRELGVSQTPIRAALIRLENEGLVVKTHNVGYSAAPMPSHRRFAQIYEMRLLLEPYATALAARNMDAEALLELQDIVKNMEMPSGDNARVAYGKFAVQDAEFHAWIAKRSGNELIAETLNRLHAHMHLFRLRFHSDVTEDAINEHAQIVAALIARDEKAAESAMRCHLERSLGRMAPYFAQESR